jgi:hypothetical protein
MKNLKSIIFFSTILTIFLSGTASAELVELQDTDMRSISGQALTQEERELYAEVGDVLCRAVCPITSTIGATIPISLKGGVTGALFGLDGDFGTGFIGQALNSIEGVFN